MENNETTDCDVLMHPSATTWAMTKNIPRLELESDADITMRSPGRLRHHQSNITENIAVLDKEAAENSKFTVGIQLEKANVEDDSKQAHAAKKAEKATATVSIPGIKSPVKPSNRIQGLEPTAQFRPAGSEANKLWNDFGRAQATTTPEACNEPATATDFGPLSHPGAFPMSRGVKTPNPGRSPSMQHLIRKQSSIISQLDTTSTSDSIAFGVQREPQHGKDLHVFSQQAQYSTVCHRNQAIAARGIGTKSRTPASSYKGRKKTKPTIRTAVQAEHRQTSFGMRSSRNQNAYFSYDSLAVDNQPRPLLRGLLNQVVSAQTRTNPKTTSTSLHQESHQYEHLFNGKYANTWGTSTKKTLSVESPAFTPATLPVPGKGATISAQAASAAPFTPRNLASGTATPSSQIEAEPTTFNPAQAREFTPQNYDVSQQLSTNGAADAQVFDPFAMAAVAQAIPSTPYNPYLEENNQLGANGAGYYQGQASYAASIQPLQYHLYAPIGPHKEDILSYQRHAHDFFMPEKIREELQKKTEATLQVMPNSQLPDFENYHSLVALDTTHHRSATVFGYPSWVYKAQSAKNGNFYCLRRLEGYKLSNENSIRSVKEWRRVDSGSVVTIHDAFTTRAFGDSSLIFVTDYHPLSKTLVEHHLASPNRFGNRIPTTVPEQVLWGYIVQIASAIKTIHEANLAVRCMEPSKVLITSKNRLRLNACSVLDVVQHDAQRALPDLQQEDFFLFGRLIVYIGTNQLGQHLQALKPLVEQMARTYTKELCDTVNWLLSPSVKSIAEFYTGIASHVVDSLDSALHAEDSLTSSLFSELENGRMARLLMKLGTINERPEYDSDPKWADTGERYVLKLFRDYVFHRVDANGHQVVDMGHIIACLNKLDAGIDEKMLLESRDGQTAFVVTYREVKKQVASAFADLLKSQRR
ncbi:hypothetical protein BP6252_04871 [Coleophoma cylindrospora]|uniref:PAN2-PAN3 deadenylation complex subunit PAN3 n=1 Tax=Coleophoma cylindrospora TaxID=1849047 RepID=A0A3D8S1P7_9HELO|nr:hypothetical protein BP6252_04871 [Coleophoma cylindrospora]